jgi:hypothetical protein
MMKALKQTSGKWTQKRKQHDEDDALLFRSFSEGLEEQNTQKKMFLQWQKMMLKK